MGFYRFFRIIILGLCAVFAMATVNPERVMAEVHITGMGMSPQKNLTAGTMVTFTATALSEEGGAVYYRFDLVPNYGNDQYDPFNNTQTIQPFSTSNTCSYIFNDPGDYIIVVFASDTMGVSEGNAIIGKNISIGNSDTVHIGNLTMDIAKTVAPGEPVTFEVSSDSDSQATVYYRFDLIPGYGTAQYDPNSNFSTLQNFSTQNSCTHTFTSPGNYILVVKASYGQDVYYNNMPIIGASITVGDTAADLDNQNGNEDFDASQAQATDPLYGYRAETPVSSVLPSSIDYSDKMPAVKSQGSTSSCTSWATGYYYKTYHESVEEGWDKNQNAYSPMYLYSMQCRNYTQPWSFIAAWETLNRYGCSKYSTMPFVDLSGSNEKSDYASVSIPDAATAEARNYRCGERNEMKGLSQVKQALTQSPVLLGINHYSNLNMSASWNPSPENNYISYDAGNGNVGHAVLCVGYDDAKFGTGALKFINSWGRDWAIDGFSWLRYSDYENIVLFSMSIQDIPNAGQAEDTTSRPSAPSDVSATDAAGPYVDITWTKASGAQYYRIFRKTITDASSYQEIGTAYQNSFRDYPVPGVVYYYSVVSYNDVGNSTHYVSDTDSKAYVDRGSAKGNALTAPTLEWTSNDDTNIKSYFSVANVATDAKAMEIMVSNNSEGPWHSFGWATPGNFSITWGEDSEYIGKKPFIRVVVSNESGASESSNTVQVAQTIVGTVDVAKISSLQASAAGTSIQLTWNTDGGNADSFEIWRWLAAEDEGNEWIFIGIVDGAARTYIDSGALSGKNYYYAVAAGYQGAFGEFNVTDTPASIVSTQSNLYLYNAVYNVGQITNPVSFQLNVWNDGGTQINDYSIYIYVYDWDDGIFYAPFDLVYASSYTSSPLSPGQSQTISLSMRLPAAYADGHYYSWVIEVDYYDEIDELYEDDNMIITTDGWWSYYLYSSLKASSKAVSDSSGALGQLAGYQADSPGMGMASARPFGKKKGIKRIIEGESIQLGTSVPENLKINDENGEPGPIRFKKPAFCVNHGNE